MNLVDENVFPDLDNYCLCVQSGAGSCDLPVPVPALVLVDHANSGDNRVSVAQVEYLCIGIVVDLEDQGSGAHGWLFSSKSKRICIISHLVSRCQSRDSHRGRSN